MPARVSQRPLRCASPSIYAHARVSLYVMRRICRPPWLRFCPAVRPSAPDLALPLAFPFFFFLLPPIIYSTFAVTTDNAPFLTHDL